MNLVVRDGDWQFRLAVSDIGSAGTADPLTRHTQFTGQYRYHGIISPEMTQVISRDIMTSLVNERERFVYAVRMMLHSMSRSSPAESFFREVQHEEDILMHRHGISRYTTNGGEQIPRFTPISARDSYMGFDAGFY